MILAVKNYPLYETTVFEDFRIMMVNVAKKYPEKEALIFRRNPADEVPEFRTYPQVLDEVRDFGTALTELGCRDQKCAIIGGGTLGWIYSYFALMSIGAVTVPLDREWPAEDLIAVINRAECQFVFYSGDIREKADAIRSSCPTVKTLVCMWEKGAEGDPTMEELMAHGHELYEGGDNSFFEYQIDPDRLASIVFTSGTTGKGKGVMLSQTNIVSDMTQGMYNFAITPKTLCVLPLHHTFGSTVNLVGHFSQGSTLYLSSGVRYIAKEMVEQQPTHLILVPLFIEKLYKKIWSTARKQKLEKPLKALMFLSNTLRKVGIDARRKMFASILKMFGGKVEMIICGGAALSQEMIDTFDAIGITLLNGYGITECAPLVTCNRNKLQKRGSVGLPIIGEELKIIDPDENGEGEIAVKGPNVMLGYYQDPEATAAVFDEDGFFKTGDYGRLDEDGWLYITGRLKNLIILSNGKNVYPEEIEFAISSSIQGVEEVVVYAGESKSDASKEVIVAEIFPDEEALKEMGVEDVQKYFSEQVSKLNRKMPPYKTVGLVKIRSTEFVKNTSRKITRFNIDKSIE